MRHPQAARNGKSIDHWTGFESRPRHHGPSHGGCASRDDRLDAVRMNFLRSAGLLVSILILPGCESGLGPSKSSTATARTGMPEAIKAEPPGAYFVGRRYYKTEYKFWGYVRASGQPC